MVFESFELKNWSAASLHGHCEMLTHKKCLSCLSLVQVTEGSYEISFDGEMRHLIPEGDLFLAPAGVVQTIVHHDNADTMTMTARWIFMDLYVNEQRIEDVLTFPKHISGKTAEELGGMLGVLLENPRADHAVPVISLCAQLLKMGTAKDMHDPEKELLKKYILDHFTQRISSVELACLLHRSLSSFYRFFSHAFGCTPNSYIHDLRLSHAALLLESTNEKVTVIAEKCGYEDLHYFIRLFKRKFGKPPSEYRTSLPFHIIEQHSSFSH